MSSAVNTSPTDPEKFAGSPRSRLTGSIGACLLSLLGACASSKTQALDAAAFSVSLAEVDRLIAEQRHLGSGATGPTQESSELVERPGSQKFIAAQALLVRIETELEKVENRRYKNFGAVAPSLNEGERDLLRATLPFLIRARVFEPEASLAKIREHSKYRAPEHRSKEPSGAVCQEVLDRGLRWFRLYRLYQDLGGATDLQLQSRAGGHFHAMTEVFESALAPDGDPSRVEISTFYHAANHYSKLLHVLYELVDCDLRYAIVGCLDSVERKFHRYPALAIHEFLDRRIEAAANEIGRQMSPLMPDRLEQFREAKADNRRDQGLRSIADAIALDSKFFFQRNSGALIEASRLSYSLEHSGTKTTWDVEVRVPRSADSSPLFLLRNRSARDMFVVIAPGNLVVTRTIPFGGRIRTARVAEHLRATIDNYASENDPQSREHLNGYDLKSYDRVVMLRVFPAQYEDVSSASLTDQFLISAAFRGSGGRERVVVTPVIFADDPAAEIKFAVEQYSKLFAGERVLFDLYLSCHGSSSQFHFSTPLKTDQLVQIARETAAELTIRTLACEQGGLTESLQRNFVASPELSAKIQAFPSSAPAGFGFVSGLGRTGPRRWIFNNWGGSVYDLFLARELLSGRSFGAAHLNADRAVKRMRGAKTDAQGLFRGRLIGKIAARREGPESV